jgi:hypothetical protein
MRAALVSIAVVALASACNGGGGGPDGGTGDGSGSGDPSTLTCREIQAALQARIAAVSHACTTEADCTIVGYPTRFGLATCDCAPAFSVGTCSGSPVNAAAWNADSRAQELLVEWEARCIPEGCTNPVCGCDCGRNSVTCSANGSCVGEQTSCF